MATNPKDKELTDKQSDDVQAGRVQAKPAGDGTDAEIKESTLGSVQAGRTQADGPKRAD